MDFLIEAFLRRLRGYGKMFKFHTVKTPDGYIVDFYDIPGSLDIALCNTIIEVPYTEEERELLNRIKGGKHIEKYQMNQIKIGRPIENEYERRVRFILDIDTYAKSMIAIDSTLRNYMENVYNKPKDIR